MGKSLSNTRFDVCKTRPGIEQLWTRLSPVYPGMRSDRQGPCQRQNRNWSSWVFSTVGQIRPRTGQLPDRIAKPLHFLDMLCQSVRHLVYCGQLELSNMMSCMLTWCEHDV